MKVMKIGNYTNQYSSNKTKKINNNQSFYGLSANPRVTHKAVIAVPVPEVLQILAAKMSDRASRINELVTGVEMTYTKLKGQQVISLVDDENRSGTGMGNTVQDALTQAYARYMKLKELSAQHRAAARVPRPLRPDYKSSSPVLSQSVVN